MKAPFLFSVFLLSATLLASCAGAPPPPDYSSLDSLAEATARTCLEENPIGGLAIGFIDKGGHRFEQGFGNVQAETLFPMASVTKMITGAALMKLVQEEKAGLDDRLSDHLPDFNLRRPHPGSPDITLKHLVTHTSGLTRDILSMAQGYCPVTPSDILGYLNRHPQITPAGYRHLYSNPGFEMLGLVIKEATGMPYHDYAREQVLLPLGMHNSFWGQRKGHPGITGFHTMFSDSLYEEMPIHYMAAGGLHSNVPEMLNFLEGLLPGARPERNILTEASLKALFTHQNTDALLDTDLRMGVSVFLEELPPPFEGQLVFHGGGAMFANTMVMMAPAYGIGTVVLCNTAGSYPLVEQLARQLIYEALRVKTGQEVRHLEPSLPREDAWPPEMQRQVTGHYVTANNVIRLVEENGQVFARAGGFHAPLTFFEDGYFSYQDGFYLKVRKMGDEHILFYLNNGQLTPFGRRRDHEPQAIPDAWAQAAGSYRSVSPCEAGSALFYESLSLSVRDNALYLGMLPEKIVRDTYGIGQPIQQILLPLDEQTAVLQGFGRYSREPVRLNLQEGILEFSGLVFVKAD